MRVQNSVPAGDMGVGTALTQFGRSIGATIGVTVMGAIVNQGLPPSVRAEGVAVHRLRAAARAQLSSALHPAFLAAAAVCVLAFVLAFVGIKERPLRRGCRGPVPADDAPRPGPTVLEAD